MADRYGTGTIAERSPYRTEDEQREAELWEQVRSIEDAERQWAAYQAEQATNSPRDKAA